MNKVNFLETVLTTYTEYIKKQDNIINTSTSANEDFTNTITMSYMKQSLNISLLSAVSRNFYQET